MAKCLRCGAGNEWIQGKVPDEPEREGFVLVPREPTREWMDDFANYLNLHSTDADNLHKALLHAIAASQDGERR